jgi:cytochrome c-type biogenesis protein CcmE
MNFPRLPRRAGVVLALLALAGSLGYMFLGLRDNLVLWLTPTELLARGEAGCGSPVRLAGMVSAESVNWDAKNLDLRFALEDFENRIAVHSKVAPPLMFREGIEVIVEGQQVCGGVFQASSVMVMHSNEYRELPEGHATPEERYRDLMRESD